MILRVRGNSDMKSKDDTHDLVRKAYAAAAEKSTCCDTTPSCCGGESAQTGTVPESDLGLSCGDPVAFSDIRPGDIVLDLGSGGGKDVFIAASITGENGQVIGVDMTDEMTALANRNLDSFKARTALDNVEFRHGLIEELPVDDSSIDLVISNCVINLAPDKSAVFREINRVLKRGGRMVVSDIVLNGELPDELKSDASLYTACIAGAMKREEYIDAIEAADFKLIEMLKEITWTPSLAGDDPVTSCSCDVPTEVSASSVTIRAWREG